MLSRPHELYLYCWLWLRICWATWTSESNRLWEGFVFLGFQSGLSESSARARMLVTRRLLSDLHFSSSCISFSAAWNMNLNLREWDSYEYERRGWFGRNNMFNDVEVEPSAAVNQLFPWPWAKACENHFGEVNEAKLPCQLSQPPEIFLITSTPSIADWFSHHSAVKN